MNHVMMTFVKQLMNAEEKPRLPNIQGYTVTCTTWQYLLLEWLHAKRKPMSVADREDMELGYPDVVNVLQKHCFYQKLTAFRKVELFEMLLDAVLTTTKKFKLRL